MKVGLSRSLVALAGVALALSAATLRAAKKEKEDPAGKLRASVSATVADPDRAARMLATVDEIEAAVGELNTLIAAERTSLAALLADYRSSREAVDASLAGFNRKRDGIARRVLATHAAFKAQATASEWKKLRKLEMEMITFAASRSLGQAAPSGKES
jgi:hypothetical protein